MTGYQPGGGRGGERPGRYGGAPGEPGSRGARREGPPARRDGPPAPRPRGAGPRGTGYADGGYRDPGHRGEPGYRGGGHREAGYPDAGYRYRDDRDGWPGSGQGQDYRDDYAARRGPGPDRYAGGRDALDGGWARGRGRRRDTTGGADGNERLTALTGALLLGLLAAEGVTILAVHQLLTLHFFIGMLLVGPVLLKAGSTGYRFARYYAGAAGYRRKGPPAPLLRLLGPFVLGLSLAVIGTGIMLAVTGPSGQLWIFLHKASFVLWFGAMSIHVLAYIWRLPRLVTGDLAVRAGARARDVLAGRPARWGLLAASILLGLVLALLTYHTAGAWAGFSGGG
ncbi:MAG: hypothetical protein ACM32E_23865 [Gemmatimonadota bacterium]